MNNRIKPNDDLENSVNPVLVICGLECEPRIRQSVAPHLDFEMQMVMAHNKEKLLAALAANRPALCVSEYFVSCEPVPAWSDDIDAQWNIVMKGLSSAMGMGSVPIQQIFEELKEASPQTISVVACHNKGYNLANDKLAELKIHPEIIKVMGFINGFVNMRYLAKLFAKAFAGRQWHGTIGGKTE